METGFLKYPSTEVLIWSTICTLRASNHESTTDGDRNKPKSPNSEIYYKIYIYTHKVVVIRKIGCVCCVTFWEKQMCTGYEKDSMNYNNIRKLIKKIGWFDILQKPRNIWKSVCSFYVWPFIPIVTWSGAAWP